MYEASDTSVCGLQLLVYEALNYSCSGMSMQRAAHIVEYSYRFIHRCPYCGIVISVYTSVYTCCHTRTCSARPILWYISALAGSMSSACLYIAMISAVGARCISSSDARNKAEVAAGNKQYLRQYLYFCTKKQSFLKARQGTRL